MEVKYNITGARRKELVEVISEIVGMKAVYMRVPTCAYAIGNFTVSKEGALIFDECSDSETVERVLAGLKQAGFKVEESAAAAEIGCGAEEIEDRESAAERENALKDGNAGLTVAMPRETFSDAALENLQKLVEAKAVLIKKALAVDTLSIEVSEDKVSFPWFSETDSDAATAYTHFITALCEIAKNQKRVTAKERPAENEKYAFRCFLLRLGSIGDEYKSDRKILLKNLTGSSAFKGGAKHELSE